MAIWTFKIYCPMLMRFKIQKVPQKRIFQTNPPQRNRRNNCSLYHRLLTFMKLAAHVQHKPTC